MTSEQGADGVLVVIPCLNEEGSIGGVVNAALKDRGRRPLLVVVADGGSTDGTRNIVSQLALTIPNIRLADNPLRLQSAGVNRAVELFGDGYRWMVRMDAHAKYPEHYVSLLIEEAEKRNAQSVVVSMHSEGRHWFQRAVALAQNSLIGAGGSQHRRESGPAGYVDHGHHALFDLATFRALKGYDRTQSHNEDAEFDERLRRAGGKLWLTRNVSVVYYPRAQASELYRQYRNYGRGRALTILRHRTRPKLRQLLPAAVLPACLLLPLAVISAVAALPFAFWVGACLLYGALLGIKTRKSYAFAVPFAAMIMHFAWSEGFWRAVLETQAGEGPRRAPEAP